MNQSGNTSNQNRTETWWQIGRRLSGRIFAPLGPEEIESPAETPAAEPLYVDHQCSTQSILFTPHQNQPIVESNFGDSNISNNISYDISFLLQLQQEQQDFQEQQMRQNQAQTERFISSLKKNRRIHN